MNKSMHGKPYTSTTMDQENQIFRIVERIQDILCSTSVTESDMKKAMMMMLPMHYDHVCEERFYKSVCGYPLCKEQVDSSLTQDFIIEKDGKQERTSVSFFCDEECKSQSIGYRGKLSDESLRSRAIFGQFLGTNQNVNVEHNDFKPVVPIKKVKKVVKKKPSKLSKVPLETAKLDVVERIRPKKEDISQEVVVDRIPEPIMDVELPDVCLPAVLEDKEEDPDWEAIMQQHPAMQKEVTKKSVQFYSEDEVRIIRKQEELAEREADEEEADQNGMIVMAPDQMIPNGKSTTTGNTSWQTIEPSHPQQEYNTRSDWLSGDEPVHSSLASHTQSLRELVTNAPNMYKENVERTTKLLLDKRAKQVPLSEKAQLLKDSGLTGKEQARAMLRKPLKPIVREIPPPSFKEERLVTQDFEIYDRKNVLAEKGSNRIEQSKASRLAVVNRASLEDDNLASIDDMNIVDEDGNIIDNDNNIDQIDDALPEIEDEMIDQSSKNNHNEKVTLSDDDDDAQVDMQSLHSQLPPYAVAIHALGCWISDATLDYVKKMAKGINPKDISAFPKKDSKIQDDGEVPEGDIVAEYKTMPNGNRNQVLKQMLSMHQKKILKHVSMPTEASQIMHSLIDTQGTQRTLPPLKAKGYAFLALGLVYTTYILHNKHEQANNRPQKTWFPQGTAWDIQITPLLQECGFRTIDLEKVPYSFYME